MTSAQHAEGRQFEPGWVYRAVYQSTPTRYIEAESNWRPSACEADVIATRPWVLRKKNQACGLLDSHYLIHQPRIWGHVTSRATKLSLGTGGATPSRNIGFFLNKTCCTPHLRLNLASYYEKLANGSRAEHPEEIFPTLLLVNLGFIMCHTYWSEHFPLYTLRRTFPNLPRFLIETDKIIDR